MEVPTNRCGLLLVRSEAVATSIKGNGAAVFICQPCMASASSIDSISGCLYKKVVEPLNGVHGRLFDRALSDLADGRKRHAAGAGNRALRDALFPQSCHHIVVNSDVGVHGNGA